MHIQVSHLHGIIVYLVIELNRFVNLKISVFLKDPSMLPMVRAWINDGIDQSWHIFPSFSLKETRASSSESRIDFCLLLLNYGTFSLASSIRQVVFLELIALFCSSSSQATEALTMLWSIDSNSAQNSRALSVNEAYMMGIMYTQSNLTVHYVNLEGKFSLFWEPEELKAYAQELRLDKNEWELVKINLNVVGHLATRFSCICPQIERIVFQRAKTRGVKTSRFTLASSHPNHDHWQVQMCVSTTFFVFVF